MTPQQRDALNRFLAEKVMGWKVDRPIGYTDTYYMLPGGEWRVIESFSPIDSWGDCEPLLDKIEQDGWKWEIGMTDDQHYYAKVDKNCNPWVVAVIISQQRAEALCLVIARGYGWKEDV